MIIHVLSLLLHFTALLTAFYAGLGHAARIRGWWVSAVLAIVATLSAWSALLLP